MHVIADVGMCQASSLRDWLAYDSFPALKRWTKLRRPCGTVTWQTPHFYPEPLQFAVITRFVLLLFGGLQRDGFSWHPRTSEKDASDDCIH